MKVAIYESGNIEPTSHHETRRVDIELEDGQSFTFLKRDNLLSVSVDGTLLIVPRASNTVLLEDAQ